MASKKISYGTAKKIVDKSDFPGELTEQKYAGDHKDVRRKIIAKRSKDAKHCAAIEIQRCWRGYRGRCNVFAVKDPILSNVALYSNSVSGLDRMKDTELSEDETQISVSRVPSKPATPKTVKRAPSPPPKQKQKPTKKKSPALRRLEKYYREYTNEEREKGTPPELIFRFAEFCAAFIQKWWRTVDLEKVHICMLRDMVEEEVEYEEEEEYEETAEDGEESEEVEVEVEVETEAQDEADPTKTPVKRKEKRIVRMKKPKEKVKVKKTRTVKKVKVVQKKPENVKQVVYAAFQQHLKGLKDERSKELMDKEDAACKIQRAWRRHIDVQVYKYYRDLINFKTQGDPALMLRCINPNESKLLDPGTGVHVRFRLAGDRFPPNIYYKIFTHRPIIDMCANSPKDYTKASSKKPVAFDKNNRNRQPQLPQDTDKTGWYQRVENNGWRLVSDRLIHHIMSDPITWETSKKKYEFHHDKLQRKQDVEKRRKEKKISWMKKMYQEGMLKARAHDEDTVKLIEGAAAGMVATMDKLGPQALEEWEVDELLDWTTSLNFEDYWTGWKDLATSAYSEQKADDKRRVYSDYDPYELTLSTGGSHLHSTRQSQNTPVSVIK